MGGGGGGGGGGGKGGMVLNKILDQYLSSHQVLFKSNKGFRDNEILKNFNILLAQMPVWVVQ